MKLSKQAKLNELEQELEDFNKVLDLLVDEELHKDPELFGIIAEDTSCEEVKEIVSSIQKKLM